VRLRTVALAPAQARAGLGEGHIDIAVSNFPVRSPLHEAVLGKPGYATIARPDHPTIRSKLTLAAFCKSRHVLVRPGSAGVKHGEVVEKALRALNAQVALQIGHFFPVGAIVSQSDLVATVPWGIAKSIERMVPIAIYKPPMPLPLTHLSLIWHERHHRDPGNAWLRELFLRETRALYQQG
jgi:DNA-binding transcriptional LysR family regulator